MPPGMPGPEPAPRFFYLKYGPTPAPPRSGEFFEGHGMGGGRNAGGPALSPPGATDQPDQVEQSVRHLNGKIFVVSTPADFSKALATIGR